jgi:phage terminase large subunit GpA-like protein
MSMLVARETMILPTTAKAQEMTRNHFRPLFLESQLVVKSQEKKYRTNNQQPGQLEHPEQG